MSTPDRILTTHTGSLPRPADLIALLERQALGESVDESLLERRIGEEVRAVVKRQADTGIDLVNDGETGKFSYSAYVKERMSGFSHTGTKRVPVPSDAETFPNFFQGHYQRIGAVIVPRCEGPIAYTGQAALQRDIDNLRAALKDVSVVGGFMSAASPGVIARFIPNAFYPSHDAYVRALADAMKTEYDAIHAAGFLLQVDCPELTGNRDIPGVARGTDIMDLHLSALNHALRDIPPERVRIHLCWGNYEGPHHLDTPLRAIVERVFGARAAAISIEAANPRHAHEWSVFRDIPLPAGRTVVPGVLDTTTNFIEHPELVAQRLERFASVVGRDRVVASTDCGFATFASMSVVDPDIAWAKLAAMVEGARIASRTLWAA
jgi:5-methyltetrahydropteroyltriglutamate--homocysteine methyltransferase